MAEPLKNQYGAEIPRQIGQMITAVYPSFNTAGFVAEVLEGYEELELKARGRKIAQGLHHFLPADYDQAIEILLASAGPVLETVERMGMAPFLYLPHMMFIAEYGLEHFETSMRAQYELTQRFSAEFTIRFFLEKYPERTLARLREWTQDRSFHVRRLVSEGTRPRLPWAGRLPQFQKDPTPVLALLELLKDDPELYVRRSVANNLNDIGKDHPQLLAEVAQNWLVGASPERQWLVNHALRSAVKRTEPGALAVLGFGQKAQVELSEVEITPAEVAKGQAVIIQFALTNPLKTRQELLVDFQIYFVKASGKSSPKVFKLKTVSLAPHETITLRKKVSLAEMSTRKHYPGLHQVEVLVNGQAQELGAFQLLEK